MKITFTNALTLLFVGLKLTGHIDWSWWLVLAPTWVPAGVFLVAISLSAGAKWLEWKMMSPAERALRNFERTHLNRK